MFNSVFKLIYFIELLIATVIRKIYTSGRNSSDYKLKKAGKLETVFLVLNGIGMVVPIIYVLSPVLDFANYSLPNWIGWAGVALFAFSIWLLWRSHHDLGKNWTVVVAMRHNHEFITSGVYAYIRHPMYAAHLGWAVAQVLMLHNWIAGYSFLIVQIPFYVLRIKNEEKMLIEQFGTSYEAYMAKTGRFIPKFK